MDNLVKKRKSEVRYCVELSNRQLLHIYFYRVRDRDMGRNGVSGTWIVALHIGGSRKYANKWFGTNNGKAERVTGECGLEGMKTALDIILKFRETIKKNEMIIVDGYDKRRVRVYKRLERYGFDRYFLDDLFIGYGSFNPLYHGGGVDVDAKLGGYKERVGII